jgi:hypothetical protein
VKGLEEYMSFTRTIYEVMKRNSIRVKPFQLKFLRGFQALHFGRI